MLIKGYRISTPTDFFWLKKNGCHKLGSGNCLSKNGGESNLKCMVMLKNVPYDSALFGLVSYNEVYLYKKNNNLTVYQSHTVCQTNPIGFFYQEIWVIFQAAAGLAPSTPLANPANRASLGSLFIGLTKAIWKGSHNPILGDLLNGTPPRS